MYSSRAIVPPRSSSTGAQPDRRYSSPNLVNWSRNLDRRVRHSDIRCSCPNVQTSQLRPISGRSQFEVSEAPLFADVPHVGRQHGQHLLVGPAVLRPPGYGVNGKSMTQILQARRQRAVLSENARCPSKPAKCWPQQEVR